jgi:LysM repeat protein
VVDGDTACIFGGRYAVEPAVLLAMNGLSPDPDAPLPVGRQLVLPVDAPALHRVRQGDTLFSLGRYYAVSVEAFVLWNDLGDADRLRAGTLLTIPPDAVTACPPDPVPPVAAAGPDPVPPVAAAPPDPVPPVAAAPPDPVPPVAAAPPDASRAESIPSGASGAAIVALDSDDQRDALAHARTTVGAAEERYRSADFPGALSLVEVARHILRPLPVSEEADALAAQAAWISGLALVGLDRNEDAVEAFRAALERDPALESALPLSPKVAPLVEAARAELGSPDEAR